MSKTFHRRGPRTNRSALCSAVALVVVAATFGCGPSFHKTGKKLVIIGIDGMDPRLLEQFIASGHMQNFQKLGEQGDREELQTSNPPQSPVAWSNFITGRNSGGHGVFDFVHRDPTRDGYPVKSFTPPDGKSHAAKAFWEYLEDEGIRADIYHIPANYPPRVSDQTTFPDMGAPDLQGGIDGTYFFFTEEASFDFEMVKSGRAFKVTSENGIVREFLYGPKDSEGQMVRVPFTCALDPEEPLAYLEVEGGDSIVLEKGQWSDWITVEFEVDLLTTVSGICHFLLQDVRPFKLYCSPLNIDPSDPFVPISTPDDDAVIEVTRVIGPHYTQGLAEETRALMEKVIDDEEFLEQADFVTDERMRMLDYALDRFDDGVLFFYFSAIDLRCHMMWRHIEPSHPAREEKLAQLYATSIRDSYVRMDQALGFVRERVGEDTPILVMSDHGFAPFTRKVHLNNWLLNEDYLAASDVGTEGAATSADEQEMLENIGYADVEASGGDKSRAIDWTKTRAYAKGFNSIYLNLEGREKNGIVKAREADALLTEISQKLLVIEDPSRQNKKVVRRVDRGAELYQGPFTKDGPDLVVGYERHYGASDPAALGELAHGDYALEDNTSYWSGNHLMAPEVVPGILLSNRQVALRDPGLCDLTVTILRHFGVAVQRDMIGRPLFE